MSDGQTDGRTDRTPVTSIAITSNSIADASSYAINHQRRNAMLLNDNKIIGFCSCLNWTKRALPRVVDDWSSVRLISLCGRHTAKPVSHYRIATQKSLPRPIIFQQESAPPGDGFLPANCRPGITFLGSRRYFNKGEIYQIRDYLSLGGFFKWETF